MISSMRHIQYNYHSAGTYHLDYNNEVTNANIACYPRTDSLQMPQRIRV